MGGKNPVPGSITGRNVSLGIPVTDPDFEAAPSGESVAVGFMASTNNGNDYEPVGSTVIQEPGTATVTWEAPTPGNHSVYAVALDSYNLTTSSET